MGSSSYTLERPATMRWPPLRRPGVNTSPAKDRQKPSLGPRCRRRVELPDFRQTRRDFFRTATTNLPPPTGRRRATPVALSVVGTDQLALQSGYFQAKLLQEKLIGDGPIPFTIVHATQFFEFINTLADSATVGDTVETPALFQPMAGADIAEGRRRLRAQRTGERHRRNRWSAGVSAARCHQDRADRTRRHPRGHRRSRSAVLGIPLEERTLVPGDGATLFDTRLEEWILEAAAKA